MTIGVIGAGQLGSRHIQGLLKSDLDFILEVIDPSSESLLTAKKRAGDVDKNAVNNMLFHRSISEMSNDLDIVIVATNADIRYKVVIELLNTKNVKYLVLEKVLFQCIDDFINIKKLLKDNQVKCWVNHPRRMFPFYMDLKGKINNADSISFNVIGGNWGLACNGLHFIDLFSFLTDSKELLLSSDMLNNKILDSKRKGFVEFNGQISGLLSGNLFSMNSLNDDSPVLLTINTRDFSIVINESNNEYCLAEKDNKWRFEILRRKIVNFQSELSNYLIEDIIHTGDCNLPTYDVAMKLHIPFITALLDHYNQTLNKNIKKCPIT